MIAATCLFGKRRIIAIRDDSLSESVDVIALEGSNTSFQFVHNSRPDVIDFIEIIMLFALLNAAIFDSLFHGKGCAQFNQCLLLTLQSSIKAVMCDKLAAIESINIVLGIIGKAMPKPIVVDDISVAIKFSPHLPWGRLLKSM